METQVARGELTAGDIARRIAREGDDHQALIERVRHWTREGLLITQSAPRARKHRQPATLADLGLHPGPGRYRQYDEEQVYRAAVLNVLADRGATVRQLTTLIEGFSRLEKEDEELWEQAKAGKGKGKDRILLATQSASPRVVLVQGAAGVARLFDHVDAVTIVNLEILAFVKSS